jgi:radical SAM superfamily enzyme YgiQ (UPF0313 family)
MKNSESKLNIIFIDGLEPQTNVNAMVLGYLFPIGAMLEEYNMSFKVLNVKTLLNYSILGIIDELKKWNFDAIGMTTNSDNIRYVYKICSSIKNQFPKTTIILGGPEASFADEKTLSKCECDVVVREEGEVKLVEILKCISQNRSFEHVRGISFKKNGKIIKNVDAMPLDVNSLPIPQYAILSNKKYWIIPSGVKEDDYTHILDKLRKSYKFFMSGRGCPHNCAFCVEGSLKRKYRAKKVELVKQDLEYFISQTNTDYLIISDDTFTSSPKRVKDMCSMIKEVRQKYRFVWFCEGRIDALSKNPELLSVMYEAGLRKIQLGVESGNQKVLDIYNKNITLEQTKKVINETAKYERLLVHGNILLGNPEETFNEFKDSLNFIKDLIKLSDFKLNISNAYVTPFHGTPLRNNPEKYNIEILIDDFEFVRFGMNDIVCRPKSLSLDELIALKPYTDGEILKCINENIFKYPRNKIIKYFTEPNRVTFHQNGILDTLGRLASFQKYLQIVTRSTTVDSTQIDVIQKSHTLSPLRLWEIEYNKDTNQYNFIDLSGINTIIDGKNAYLWEKATGKNTLYEIFAKADDLSLEYIAEFYQTLEAKMAIVFVEF